MGYSVFVNLTADGNVIEGDINRQQLRYIAAAERVATDHMECLDFRQSISIAYQQGSVSANSVAALNLGRIVFHKRVDKASGKLYDALVKQHDINATFKFFRPQPEELGDAETGETEETEKFMTFEILGGQIVSITLDEPLEPNEPAIETIQIAFDNVDYLYSGTTSQGPKGNVPYAWPPAR